MKLFKRKPHSFKNFRKIRRRWRRSLGSWKAIWKALRKN
jgi:hypothetical protein